MNNAVPRNERIQRALASCMALAAGYLDGYGLLVLGSYVSFMSGNSTMTAVKAGHGNWAAALTPAIAIASFLAGSAVGNVIVHLRKHHASQLVFILIAALLVTVALVGGQRTDAKVNVTLLSSAMGMVNPVLPKIGAESISLTFMTGTLSRIGGHLGLAVIGAPVPGSEGPWDTHLHRARVGAQLWASFLIGAGLAGAAMPVAGNFALWPAIAGMLFIAFASSYAETRDAKMSAPTAAEKSPLAAQPTAPSVERRTPP